MQRNNCTSNFAVINGSKFVEQNSIEDDSKSTPPTFNIKQYENLIYPIRSSTILSPVSSSSGQAKLWSYIVGPSFFRKDRTGNFYSTSSFHVCTLGTWIIDSRASDRICSSLFNSCQLANVLHISEFSFKLLSAPKLCKDLHCTVCFTNSKCVT
jgi:hypothetical protein